MRLTLPEASQLFFQTLHNRPQPSSERFFDLIKYRDLKNVALLLLHLAPPTEVKNMEAAQSKVLHPDHTAA